MIMERPHQTEFSTPVHEVITALGKIDCDWSNTSLIRRFDPYENHIEYNDGDSLHKLNVLDDDWEALSQAKFPWEYWPDMARFETGDFIKVEYGANAYEFRPCDTVLRLFDDDNFNHVEHRLDHQTLKGIKVVPALWRMMFKGDYPVKYLPYIDAATQQWYDALGGPK